MRACLDGVRRKRAEARVPQRVFLRDAPVVGAFPRNCFRSIPSCIRLSWSSRLLPLTVANPCPYATDDTLEWRNRSLYRSGGLPYSCRTLSTGGAGVFD